MTLSAEPTAVRQTLWGPFDVCVGPLVEMDVTVLVGTTEARVDFAFGATWVVEEAEPRFPELGAVTADVGVEATKEGDFDFREEAKEGSLG